MSTSEEVRAAQERMKAAEVALRAYTDRPPGQPADFKLHARLANDLKQATDNYVALVAQLDRG